MANILKLEIDQGRADEHGCRSGWCRPDGAEQGAHLFEIGSPIEHLAGRGRSGSCGSSASRCIRLTAAPNSTRVGACSFGLSREHALDAEGQELDLGCRQRNGLGPAALHAGRREDPLGTDMAKSHTHGRVARMLVHDQESCQIAWSIHEAGRWVGRSI